MKPKANKKTKASQIEKKLQNALLPFSAIIALIDALPIAYLPSDRKPLREVLPGEWPTLGELRALVDTVKKLD